MRIVFMGTPEFAVPSLSILLDAGYDVCGVITATDKTGGRGRNQVLESDVKKFAAKRGLRVLQPRNLKAPEFISELQDLRADLQVVVAFRMLPEAVWAMPPLGTMNLHGSLLPAYRGAAPINWAIMQGETRTGVTSFLLKHAIDTGDMLLQRSLDIGPDETAGELHDRMMVLGAEVVLESVRGIETGSLKPRPQDDSRVSHAPKITHETCQIDFGLDVRAVHNVIRGLSPYPTAWTTLDGMQMNVYRSALTDQETSEAPGTIISKKHTLDVACSTGVIRLLEVQVPGKRRMKAVDFLNGYTIRRASVGL